MPDAVYKLAFHATADAEARPECAAPSEEQLRRETLRKLQILDTEPEERLDSIVRMAAAHMGAELASIDFLDGQRIWSKSLWNTQLRQFPREESFAEQIVRTGSMLLVADMQAVNRPRGFYRPDTVMQVRFFAGVPIQCSNGVTLGALCVAGTQPRAQITQDEILALENLASLVSDQLELRSLRAGTQSTSAETHRRVAESASVAPASVAPAPVVSGGMEASEDWPTAAELQYALDRDQFVLFYQPEVEIATGRIVGLEALIRWKHPRRGLLSPQSFIPHAEENGMILPIGDWGLAHACRQLQAWKQDRPWLDSLRVCVNLSARQFTRHGLADQIESLLQTTGLRAHHLGLEMTESTLIPSIGTTVSVLNSLQRLGVSLHMDDFGTGYSSLSHLHRFPFDVLKVDRSFVKRMTMGTQPLQIVKTILELARILGMDVVAEGIETEEQRALLHKLGCRFGQGYLFSRPLAANEMEKLLESPETRIGFSTADGRATA